MRPRNYVAFEFSKFVLKIVSQRGFSDSCWRGMVVADGIDETEVVADYGMECELAEGVWCEEGW